jgi:GTP pyrophosphokinase
MKTAEKIQYSAEAENKLILNSFRSLQRLLKDTPKTEMAEIQRAFQYAREAHKGVYRKSGEPYILHPIGVARIVVEEMGLFSTSVICAFLHDVVEDTDITLEDIQRDFNTEVRSIIDGLTKISVLEQADERNRGNESLQAENFRRILLTISDDIRVILIKIADRLHNMRTLGSMKEEKKLKIASETLYLYAPLAHRLGLYSIKSELEDLSLKHSLPEEYEKINQTLNETKEQANQYIKSFVSKIKDMLGKVDFKFSIKSRFKSIYSIYNKIHQKHVPFEEIFDIYAIRIIPESREDKEILDCWHVYSIISATFRSHPNRMRNWLDVPKENGYQALHVTVLGPDNKWVEIQIRTEKMDEMAEKGVAAHWKYKGEGNLDDALSVWIEEARQILENPNFNALEAVREFKRNLQLEVLYVFTPKGHIKRFPSGATALDFAYRIHTNVGNQAIAAKVNNRMVTLSYILKTGDQVEIVTSKKQQPSEEWLKIVKTNRALECIKEQLNKQRKELITRGQDIFEWRLKRYNLSSTHPVVKEILTYFDFPTREDLYVAVAQHRIDTDKIREFVNIKKEGKSIPTLEETPQKREEALLVNEDVLVLGKNIEISERVIATCCNPVPGDEIFAFQDGSKMIIHRTACPETTQLLAHFGSKAIKAKWTNAKTISYLTALKVVGNDRQGMLMDLLRIISTKMKLNIRKVTIASKNGYFEGLFLVYVKDKDQLNYLMERLKTNVLGVESASRTDSNFEPFEGE